MCDKNIIELLNLDFASVNDEFNWVTTGSTPIETVNGQLKLVPGDGVSFSRGLGALDASNDRVHLQIKLDLYRPQTSQHGTMNVVFGVYAGNTLIDNFQLSVDEIGTGAVISHHFDRFYKYSELSGNVSLRITVPEGFNNQIFLDTLKADNQRFCEDDIRTFFVVDEFLQNAVGSVSSAFQLLEFKVAGVETLTQAFFDENTTPGGDPATDWFLAHADIDGSNRVADAGDPNTFNPFESELGLTFEDVPGNYHGGKPTGTASGSDYGAGILTMGFSKPAILTGDLESKKGAFFIDVDFSKNLKVVFNVIVNNTNVNPFDSPAIFRKYTIEWDATTCSKRFYFQDQLATDTNKINPVDKDGFLSGITAGVSLTEIVACDQSFSYSGNAGTFEFQIDFGTEIGECGIDYNAMNVPDKFEVEWNGQIYSSGFVGSSSYNQQLLNLGIPQSQIKTGDPSTGTGQLKFNKTSASPASAIIRVFAPLGSTGWDISGICPNGVIKTNPVVDISTARPQYGVNEEITINVLVDVAVDAWEIDFGDGTTQSGSGTPPASITKTFTTQGYKTIKMTATGANGLSGSDSVTVDVFTDSSYTKSGTFSANCSSGMNGTITVNSGFISVRNEALYYSGNNQMIGAGATITINDGTTNVASLGTNQQTTLGPGTYTVTSGPADCSNGSGVVNLIIL